MCWGAVIGGTLNTIPVWIEGGSAEEAWEAFGQGALTGAATGLAGVGIEAGLAALEIGGVGGTILGSALTGAVGKGIGYTVETGWDGNWDDWNTQDFFKSMGEGLLWGAASGTLYTIFSGDMGAVIEGRQDFFENYDYSEFQKATEELDNIMDIQKGGAPYTIKEEQFLDTGLGEGMGQALAMEGRLTAGGIRMPGGYHINRASGGVFYFHKDRLDTLFKPWSHLFIEGAGWRIYKIIFK